MLVIISNVVETMTVFPANRIAGAHSENGKCNPCFQRIILKLVCNSFTWNKLNLTLKLHTIIEEAGFADAFNRMFTGEWRCVKILHSS
jgi:hypothetical protein